MMTCLIVLLCCVVVTVRLLPFVIALGLTANLCAVDVARVMLLQSGASRNDEDLIGRIVGVPPLLLIGVELVLLLVAWYWLVRYIPRGQRSRALGATLLGAAIGTTSYFSSIGPLLLP